MRTCRAGQRSMPADCATKRGELRLRLIRLRACPEAAIDTGNPHYRGEGGAICYHYAMRRFLHRRHFMALLGGVAASWVRPLTAQPSGKRARIGVLSATRDNPIMGPAYSAFIDELRGLGFEEGRNLFARQSDLLTELAMRYRLPSMFIFRAYTRAGGLMSYGADNVAMYRQGARYVAKILQGSSPANLPVELPVKFEFSVNLKTAKALNVELPTSILLRADEVIE